MCHVLDLRDRLSAEQFTYPARRPAADKLQVVKINERTWLDLLALLADHAPDHGGGAIDLGRVVHVLSADWGFEHTAGQPGAAARLCRIGSTRDGGAGRQRAAAIEAALSAAPKTLAWKIRSRWGSGALVRAAGRVRH